VNDHPEPELLARFVAGSEDAFEILFRRFESQVFAWVRRLVRDPGAAEEVVVETFWRAFRGRARFDPARSFGPWLRQIASRAAFDHLRREARRRRVESSRADLSPGRPGAEADTALRESIALALDRLSPKLQTVALLALVEELSHAEIAEMLDLPPGTVKSRLSRAVEKLGRELARLGVRP
jgi:RNA polymerase sigma-70 factor (ECF subfamily)